MIVMENKKNTRVFYSVGQFCELLGEGTVSKSYIYQKIRKGDIPVKYFGIKPLIPAAWVDDFINSVKVM